MCLTEKCGFSSIWEADQPQICDEFEDEFESARGALLGTVVGGGRAPLAPSGHLDHVPHVVEIHQLRALQTMHIIIKLATPHFFSVGAKFFMKFFSQSTRTDQNSFTKF